MALIKADQGHVGRDATDPRLLIGLWLYGCTDGVGSARKLDRLCKTCDACKWLCGGVSVALWSALAYNLLHFGTTLLG